MSFSSGFRCWRGERGSGGRAGGEGSGEADGDEGEGENGGEDYVVVVLFFSPTFKTFS